MHFQKRSDLAFIMSIKVVLQQEIKCENKSNKGTIVFLENSPLFCRAQQSQTGSCNLDQAWSEVSHESLHFDNIQTSLLPILWTLKRSSKHPFQVDLLDFTTWCLCDCLSLLLELLTK